MIARPALEKLNYQNSRNCVKNLLLGLHVPTDKPKMTTRGRFIALQKMIRCRMTYMRRVQTASHLAERIVLEIRNMQLTCWSHRWGRKPEMYRRTMTKLFSAWNIREGNKFSLLWMVCKALLKYEVAMNNFSSNTEVVRSKTVRPVSCSLVRLTMKHAEEKKSYRKRNNAPNNIWETERYY